MEFKLNKDTIIDGLGAGVCGYVAWVALFNQPGIPGLDPFFAVIGTAAVTIIAWRFFRKK